MSGTRSCSWCRWARSSRPCWIQSITGRARRPGSSSGYHCGSGSRSSSPLSPRPWPKDAARRRPPRSGRPADLKAKRLKIGVGSDLTIGVPPRSSGRMILSSWRPMTDIPADGELSRVWPGERSGGHRRIAPVIREAGGDRSAVTGGTTVIANWIIVEVTANPGETFLDRMIALIEGAKRQRPRRDRAGGPAGCPDLRLPACLPPCALSIYSVKAAGHGTP